MNLDFDDSNLEDNFTKKPQLILHCLAYGRLHRNSLIDYLFPSLFNSLETSRGNLRITLLITTTAADREVIVETTFFKRLKKHLSIDFTLIPNSLLSSNSLWKSGIIMSRSHQDAFDFAVRNQQFISFLSPDTMVSTQFISRIEQFVIAETSVALLAPAVRLTYLDEFLLSLTENNRDDFGARFAENSLVMSSLKNLHAEAASFNFKSDNFLAYQDYRYPTTVFFPSENFTSLVGFGMSWFIMAIDTKNIRKRNLTRASRRLNYETIDAGFLHSLLNGYFNRIEFIQDSCDSFIVSWDPTRRKTTLYSDAHFPVGSLEKLNYIRWGLYSGIYDKFKIQHFSTNWFWHTEHKREIADGLSSIPGEFADFMQPRHLLRAQRFQALKLLTLNAKLRSTRRQFFGQETKCQLMNSVVRVSFSFLKTLLTLVYRIWQSICNFLKRKFKNFIFVLRQLIRFNRYMDNGLNLPNKKRHLALIRMYLLTKKRF